MRQYQAYDARPGLGPHRHLLRQPRRPQAHPGPAPGQLATYGFADDPGGTSTREFDPPHGTFLVASAVGGPAIACWGWCTAGPGTAEFKRLYVGQLARGQGLARRLLEALEQHARHSGKTRVILETGALSHAALGLFTSCGFTFTESYVEGRSPDINRAMQKTLSPPATGQPEQAARAPLPCRRPLDKPLLGPRPPT